MRGSIRQRRPGRWELRVALGRDPVTGRRRDRSVAFTAAEEYSPEMGMFIRLAALLGARRGEVCGLRWEDFDELVAPSRCAAGSSRWPARSR